MKEKVLCMIPSIIIKSQKIIDFLLFILLILFSLFSLFLDYFLLSAVIVLNDFYK